jgi:tetratricopeptide (TPR) repeat protein
LLGSGHSAKTLYNGVGAILFQLGRVEEAIASFGDALSIDPDYVDALNNIGLAYRAAGRAEESIRFVKKALVIEPGNATARKNLADFLEIDAK